jgi:hypothetical protein
MLITIEGCKRDDEFIFYGCHSYTASSYRLHMLNNYSLVKNKRLLIWRSRLNCSCILAYKIRFLKVIVCLAFHINIGDKKNNNKGGNHLCWFYRLERKF